MSYSTGFRCYRGRVAVRLSRQLSTQIGQNGSENRVSYPTRLDLGAWRRITDKKSLFKIYRHLQATHGPTPGLDGFRYEDFTAAEIHQALRHVDVALRAETYKPYAERNIYIPKTKGGVRKLSLLTIIDRVVATAVHYELLRILEPISSDRSHGGRPGRDRLTLLANVDRDIRDGNYFMTAEDIRQAFDFVSYQQLHPIIEHVVPEERLRRLIDRMFRKPSGAVGIAQGNPVSMDLLNVLLTYRLDRPMTSAGPDTPLVWRYVDDLTFATRSAPSSNAVRQQIVELLTEIGLTLKPGGRPINLRRQGAWIEVLGLRLTLGHEGKPTYSVTRKSWVELEEALRTAHLRSDPISRASEILTGWLAAQGPALESAEQADCVLGDVQHTLRRLRLYDAYARHDVKLSDCVRKAVQRWMTLREDASRRLTHDSGDIPSGSGALRDANPPPT